MSERLERLETILAGYGSTVVAFSGGVDSTLVAHVASRILGVRSLAVTGLSPSLSAADRDQARALAAELGISHRTLETRELDRPGYRANQGDRCYHCKTELFEKLGELAAAEGFAWVASGDNQDDLGEHRPGLDAAREGGVRHPLIEAELGKADIRELAAHLGIPNHDRPASPCLASRVPHGVEVDAASLARIEAAEAALRALDFDVLRVRHHGDLARVEVPLPRFEEVLARRREIVEGVRAAGYLWVALDLAGFRSGSLNDVLDGREGMAV